LKRDRGALPAATARSGELIKVTTRSVKDFASIGPSAASAATGAAMRKSWLAERSP
jgi:hypothetical protein